MGRITAEKINSLPNKMGTLINFDVLTACTPNNTFVQFGSFGHAPVEFEPTMASPNSFRASAFSVGAFITWIYSGPTGQKITIFAV